MRFEVLHISECPNTQKAVERLEEALIKIGHSDATITARPLRTSEDTVGLAFAGSPTITLDGTDLFPAGGQTNELACRVYATPAGLAGAPTITQIINAIESRAH